MIQETLFNEDRFKYSERLNPKISTGKGPVGKYCKDCDNCRRKEYHNKVYYKCKLLGNSNGAGTDIRLKWPACYYFKQDTIGE